MSTLAELVADVYFNLGTTPGNKAFPPSAIQRKLNDAAHAFWEDCLESYADAMAVPVQLVADTTDPSAYIFASQTPALGDVAKIVEVRMTDSKGLLIDEVPFSERQRCGGYTYSLLGVGSAVTLYTGRNIAASAALYMAYVPAAADLVADNQSPTWLPSRFHDVLALKATKLAAGSGNEQTMSPLLLDTLIDREGQARFAFGQRSLTPTSTRTQGV